MDKQTEHQLTQTVNALRCVAIGIASALDQDATSAQQVYDLLTTIANQQDKIIQCKNNPTTEPSTG